MRCKAILAAMMLMSSVSLSLGQQAGSHHEHHTDFYSKWQTTTGASCCNNQDCRPARDRIISGRIQVFIEDDWVDVPKEAVRPYPSPDMASHVCAIGKRIICFVSGGGV